jgi:predicted  nucleic acid-binding Zn ribbon protein
MAGFINPMAFGNQTIPKQDEFSWDPISAGRKLFGDSHVTLGIPGVASIEKDIGPSNPEQDAYRNCSRCGKHWNYHVNGHCPN